MKEYKLKENAKKCVASLNRTEAYKFQSSGQTIELSPDFGKIEGIYSFEWLSVLALSIGPSTPQQRWSRGFHMKSHYFNYPVHEARFPWRALQFPTKRRHVYPSIGCSRRFPIKHRRAPSSQRRRNGGSTAVPNACRRAPSSKGCELLHHDQFHHQHTYIS